MFSYLTFQTLDGFNSVPLLFYIQIRLENIKTSSKTHRKLYRTKHCKYSNSRNETVLGDYANLIKIILKACQVEHTLSYLLKLKKN